MSMLLPGEKGWKLKKQALPSCGIAKKRKNRVHTDQSSKQTWSEHQEENISLKIKPAHRTGGRFIFGHQKPLPNDRSFYKIFHLLLHARLTLLRRQLPSCLLHIMGISAMQERTCISPPPLTQHKRLRSFSSKCHTGMWMVLQVCVANVQNEQVASVAPLWELLLNFVFLSRDHYLRRRKSLGWLSLWSLDSFLPHMGLRGRFNFPFCTCWEST